MVFVSVDDFVGATSISKNQFERNDLEQYISDLEESLIIDLLGCELGELLIAYAKAPTDPPTQRYQDIIDKFCHDVESNTVLHQWYYYSGSYGVYHIGRQNKSRGMKEMLVGLIYFLYARDQHRHNTSTGTVKIKGEASEQIKPISLRTPYNKSIEDYQNIQYFICTQPDVYPEFNGEIKQHIALI